MNSRQRRKQAAELHNLAYDQGKFLVNNQKSIEKLFKEDDQVPVKVSKRGDKFRVVEAETNRIAKNKSGTALDGGGHKVKDKASKQASAINSSISKPKVI